jgi:hypothetical protein
VVAAGFGALVATIGAFWQAGTVTVGSVQLPIGLVGALLVTYTGARVTASLTPGRSAAVASAIGWVLAVIALTSTRPAGDIVVPGTWYGYAYLACGLAIVVGVAFTAAPLLPAASDRSRARR